MGAVASLRRPAGRVKRRAALLGARLAPYARRGDLAVFHGFQPPPWGGGNQFLEALVGELGRRGLRVSRNVVPRGARACLFNSYNFDADRLRASPRAGLRVVHRVDGPLVSYRGFDDGADAFIAAANREFADATVFQSAWSLARHRELGIGLSEPHVIPNAVDPRIFNADGRTVWDGSRPLRLISVSWSDNENKGGPTYAWLDGVLDRSRYAYTFVGRTRHPLPHGTMIEPLPSADLARLLRVHDIVVTASLNDPCSNALLEALACGLPAIYARSGGHPELVGDAGLGFDRREELPALLDRLAEEYRDRQAAISVPVLADVADAYLCVLGLEGLGGGGGG